MPLQNTYSFYSGKRLYGFRFGLNAFAAFCEKYNLSLSDFEGKEFKLHELLELMWQAHKAYHTSKGLPMAETKEELVDEIEDGGHFPSIAARITSGLSDAPSDTAESPDPDESGESQSPSAGATS